MVLVSKAIFEFNSETPKSVIEEIINAIDESTSYYCFKSGTESRTILLCKEQE